MDIITLALAKKFATKVAAGFSNVEVDGLNIIFTLNDGSKVTLTVPEPAQGVSVVDMNIDNDGSLICTLSDGTTIDAGGVPFVKPERGVDYLTDAEMEDIVNDIIEDSTNAFNQNVNQKTTMFDEHVADKIDEYDEHVQELNDEIEYLKDEINDLSDNQLIAEEEGTEIYVTDSARARLNEFEMTKESSQKTTQGYNIFPYALAETKTQNGITIISDGKGTYTINGTATENTRIPFDLVSAFTIPISFGNDGQGKFYICNNFSDNYKSYLALINNNTDIDTWYFDTVNKQNSNYTAMGGKTINKIGIYIAQGTTITNSKFSPMFTNDGDTTHDFEPYTGGEVSPSPDYPQEVEIVEGYENLFDKDNANIINCLINGTTKVITNYNDAKTLYIPINGGLTYTIYKRVSQRFAVGSSSSIPSNNVTCSVASQDNSSNKITITTNENDNYLAVFYYLNGVDTLTEQEILDSIMITEGTSSHPYVSYGNNYVDVTVTGKNLFNKDKANIINGFFNTTTGNINSNSNGRTLFIKCNVNTTYTISKRLSARFSIGYTSDTPSVGTSVSGVQVLNNSTSGTLITNDSAKYLVVFYYLSTADTLTEEEILNSIQIEKGSVATSYEPYQEPAFQTYIRFPSLVLQFPLLRSHTEFSSLQCEQPCCFPDSFPNLPC